MPKERRKTGPKSLWAILVGAILVALLAVTGTGFSAKGGNGGGKPPKDPPPPPGNFNPVIAVNGVYREKGAKSNRDVITVVDANGVQQMVFGGADGISGDFRHGAYWSPDGTRIAFWIANHVAPDPDPNSGGVHSYYITEMNMDGSGWQPPVLLKDRVQTASSLDWNPRPATGHHTIALGHGFLVNPDSDPLSPYSQWQDDIVVIDFTMSGTEIEIEAEHNITNTPEFYEWSPRWSPDGKRIAYIQSSDPFNNTIIIDDLAGSQAMVDLSGTPLEYGFGEFAWAKGNNLLAVSAAGDLWCVDINEPMSPVVFNLTQDVESTSVGDGASWIAGDTGVVYPGPEGIHILEFSLPMVEGVVSCPSSSNYNPQRRVITDLSPLRSIYAIDWWRNALCGNGTVDAGEECDGGEGCSAICTMEP